MTPELATTRRFTLRLRRYNPESGEAAQWDDFTIELEGHRSVLDGLSSTAASLRIPLAGGEGDAPSRRPGMGR